MAFRLHERSRIDVDRDRLAECQGAREDALGSGGGDEAARERGGVRKDLQLHPVTTGDSSDRARNRPPDFDPFGDADGLQSRSQVRGHAHGDGLPGIPDEDPDQASNRGQAESLAVGQLTLGEGLEVVLGGSPDRGRIGLESGRVGNSLSTSNFDL